jgi:hypothetical protein
MDGESPGIGTKKVTGKKANPTRRHKRQDDAELVTDSAVFRNHHVAEVKRALTPEEWIALRWASLTAQFYAEWRAS